MIKAAVQIPLKDLNSRLLVVRYAVIDPDAQKNNETGEDSSEHVV